MNHHRYSHHLLLPTCGFLLLYQTTFVTSGDNEQIWDSINMYLPANSERLILLIIVVRFIFTA